LEKVDGQIEAQLELVAIGEKKLQQLQMQLQALQPNSTKDAKSSIVGEIKLQIASQEGMVKACKATL
jgi:hypothetical protein